jgi:thymidylate synthase (FAD)
MNLILEPTVELVAATQFFGHSRYKIPADGTDAEKLGAFAGKGCYDSYDENGRSNIANQKRIISERHGSVLEHAHATVFVEGITRGISLEINRHRHFGISQRSTRYVAEENGAIVLEPFFASLYRKHQHRIKRVNSLGSGFRWLYNGPTIRDVLNLNPDEEEAILVIDHLNSAARSFEDYETQVKRLEAMNPKGLSGFALRKWARGKARNLLPHAAETRATYTVNYRAFRHFLEARSSEDAEEEVRVVANKILEVLAPLAPNYFADYRSRLVDGVFEWTTPYTKV